MVARRARLSWEQKTLISEECLRPNVSSEKQIVLEVCQWAKQALELRTTPSYLTVLRIIRNDGDVSCKATSTLKGKKASISVTSSYGPVIGSSGTTDELDLFFQATVLK